MPNSLSDESYRKIQFEYAVENAHDHIVITNPNGVIIYANKAAEAATGYSKDEMIGKKAGGKDLWGGQMSPEYYQDLWHTIGIEKKPYIGEISNKRKDGQIYFAETHISPILDQAGNIQFFVGIERDITKAKEIDRMKTEFISLASHQLRTPLTAIKWFIEILLTEDAGNLTESQKKYLTNVDLSNQRMIELVNALLNISRMESGRMIIDPVPTQLGTLANEVLTELTPQLKAINITPILSINPDLPLINLDAKLIRNVFNNLLTNAIKYSKPDTQIEIFISHKDQEIIVQITDHGVGIPTDQQSKIFERFFRADNVRKIVTDGNGLGLYLVKAIIESSGGKVWFQSQENQGTTFWFSLPITGMTAKSGEVTLDK